MRLFLFSSRIIPNCGRAALPATKTITNRPRTKQNTMCEKFAVLRIGFRLRNACDAADFHSRHSEQLKYRKVLLPENGLLPISHWYGWSCDGPLLFPTCLSFGKPLSIVLIYDIVVCRVPRFSIWGSMQGAIFQTE